MGCTNKKSVNHLRETPISFCRDFSNEIQSGEQMKMKVLLSFKLVKGDDNVKYGFSLILGDGKTEKKLGDTGLVQCKNSKIKYNDSYLVDYYFERDQPLIFKLTRFGFNYETIIFDFKTNLASVIGARKNTLVKQYCDAIPESLKIKATEIKNSIDCIQFNFAVSPQGDMTEKANRFYYIISSQSKLYQSEAFSILGKFKPAVIPISYFNQKGIIIDFYNYKKTKVNSYQYPVEKFLSGEVPELLAETKLPYTVTNTSQRILKYNFIDYLKSGVQLGLSIGIDYTLNNKLANDPQSLHYINPNTPNSYQKAIRSCGDIITSYTQNPLIAVYGFGAKIPNTTQVSMCFNVNMKPDPNVTSINEALEVYQQSLNTLAFSGPIYFAPLINQCLMNIRNSNNQLKYNVLMILTDGAINDMDLTIDALVEGSFLPFSVIIIGIGSGDFTSMKELDCDNKRLINSKKVQCMRDLVQFVPFEKYQNDAVRLAEEVLGELAKQIVDYYQKNNIAPTNKF